jgi:hypothetical protein
MFSIDRPTRRFVMRFATRSPTHRHPVSRRRIRPA